MERTIDNKLEVKERRKLSNWLLVQENNSINHNHILCEDMVRNKYVHGHSALNMDPLRFNFNVSIERIVALISWVRKAWTYVSSVITYFVIQLVEFRWTAICKVCLFPQSILRTFSWRNSCEENKKCNCKLKRKKSRQTLYYTLNKLGRNWLYIQRWYRFGDTLSVRTQSILPAKCTNVCRSTKT